MTQGPLLAPLRPGRPGGLVRRTGRFDRLGRVGYGLSLLPQFTAKVLSPIVLGRDHSTGPSLWRSARPP